MDKTDLAGLDAESIWNTELAHAQLCSQGRAYSKRTAERRLHEMSMLPAELDVPQLRDELGRPLNALVLNWAIEPARSRRKRVSFAQLAALP
ncbi:MAG: sulfate adenylyltransferase subunit CysD, partial [Paraburkholderia sp.]